MLDPSAVIQDLLHDNNSSPKKMAAKSPVMIGFGG
jgi:hypothetical protein